MFVLVGEPLIPFQMFLVQNSKRIEQLVSGNILSCSKENK